MIYDNLISVKVQDLKVSDLLKTVYDHIEIIKIVKRKTTSLIFYKCVCSQDYIPSKPFWYRNDDIVRILNVK